MSDLAGPAFAIVGTRTFTDRECVRNLVFRIKSAWPNAVVHTGDADGADKLVREECSKIGLPCISHKAHWRRADGSLDRAAGHKRNPDIVNPCSRLFALYGPPPSNGTDGSVAIARRNGIPVHEFRDGQWVGHV